MGTQEVNMTEIMSLSISEVKKYIRDKDIHKKAGVAGADLSNFTLEQAQSLAISEIDPRKAVKAETIETVAKVDKLPTKDIVDPLNPTDFLRLAEILRKLMGDSVSEDKVKALIDVKLDQALKEIPPKEIRIKTDTTSFDCTDMHYRAPLVYAAIQARLNVALVGPAGSGKSHLVHQLAQRERLEFSSISCNPMSSKSEVLGLVDATGEYRPSAFRLRFERGGVYLADEFDACNAGVGTIYNTAVANRICTFPDGKTVTAHKDFIFMAAMNTYGTGANMQYVGRNRLDGSTLDRFFMITLDYDENIEGQASCGRKKRMNFDLESGGTIAPDCWYELVKTVRRAAEKEKMNVIISPRASINGSKLARMNVGKNHLIDGFIRRGLSETDQNKLGLHYL